MGSSGRKALHTRPVLWGIHPQLDRRPIKRGERTGKAEAPYREFAAAVEQARAEAESDLVAAMRKASASGSWRASAWLLERSDPASWTLQAGRARPSTEPAGPDAFAEVDQLAQRRATRA